MSSKSTLIMLVALAVSATVTFAADDPKQVAACKTDVNQLHKDITATHSAGLMAFSINVAEEKDFQAHKEKLAKTEATLKKGGLTLKECKELDHLLKAELVEVVKMASSRRATHKGKIAKHATDHAKIVSMISKAKASPLLTAEAKAQIAEHEKLLAADKAKLDKILSAGGANQAEHDTLEKSLFNRNDAITKLLVQNKIQ